MKIASFIKGMSIGIAVGTAAGICVMAPLPMKKKGSRTYAGCAVRSIGDAMHDAADNMGI